MRAGRRTESGIVLSQHARVPLSVSRSFHSHHSASHFVGYVEDEESVEMIMKKFEAMEEYRKELDRSGGGGASQAAPAPEAAAAGAPDATPGAATPGGSGTSGAPETPDSEATAGMSQAQLEELFKRTSNFTVKSAMRPGMTIYDDDDDFVDALLNADAGDEEYAQPSSPARSRPAQPALLTPRPLSFPTCSQRRMMDYVDDDFWDDLEDEDRPRKRGRLPGTAGSASTSVAGRRRDLAREGTKRGGGGGRQGRQR